VSPAAPQRGRLLIIARETPELDELCDLFQHAGQELRRLTFEELRGADAHRALEPPPHLVVLDAREGEGQAVGTLRWLRARPGLERLPALLLMARSREAPLSDAVIARGGTALATLDDRRALMGKIATLVRLGVAEASLLEQRKQREAYEKVGQTEALEASVLALRRLANEWGNVLMDVQVATTIIDETLAEGGDIGDQLLAIRAAVKRGQQWIRDIGVFRLEAFDPQMLGLRDLIDRLIGIQLPSLPQSLEVQVRASQDTWPVDGDAELLELALAQLISNAVDAMRSVGTLSIDVTNVKLDSSTTPVPGLNQGPYVRLSISDTGGGIAPELEERIFEPFFTTKTGPRWKGLGLTQAQFIARRHGGIIVQRSELGRGSTFTMLLPRSQSIAATPLPDLTREQTPTPKLGFLIVDDQPRIAHGMAKLLRRSGHYALATSDPNDAVALFQDHRDEIDYVILDINLGPVSGFDLHRELEAVDPAARIVFVTGYASPNELAQFTQRARTSILEKPFSVQELLDFVSRSFED
jgi:two-component system, cell cycle sensor histidine kinase and response regulator CckA